MAPFLALSVAAPLSVWAKARMLSPEALTANVSVPLPSTRRVPNRSPRQVSRSTLANWSCDSTSPPFAVLATAMNPVSTPPKAWDSPIATVSRPSRRFAASAVRPSAAVPSKMRRADTRKSKSRPVRPSSMIGTGLHSRSAVRTMCKVEMNGVKSSSSAASVACSMRRPSVAKAITPSALLPSISTLTDVSATVPPSTSMWALRAKRPNPPPGSGLRPPKPSALRRESVSAAREPSRRNVGVRVRWPSKAALNGAPLRRTLTPARAPVSAATRSAMVALASIVWLRHTKRPVAAKLRAIAGQASDICTPERFSSMPCISSRKMTAPSVMRISEMVVTRSAGVSVRASFCERLDQLELPSAPMITATRACESERSEAPMRPNNSGTSRKRARSSSAASAGSLSLAPASTTSPRLTLPQGNSETVARPRTARSSPVAALISPLMAESTASRGMNSGPAITTTAMAASTPAIANPRRLKPAAVDKGGLIRAEARRSQYRLSPYRPLIRAVCDPFVAGKPPCCVLIYALRDPEGGLGLGADLVKAHARRELDQAHAGGVVPVHARSVLGDFEYPEVGDHHVDHARPGERQVAAVQQLGLVLGGVLHHHDHLLDAGDEVHGAAHAFDHLARDHPVGEVAVLGHLHGAEDRQVDVAAADHREAVGAGEIARGRQLGDGLFAGVDQVRVLLALERERTGAEHAVLALQLHAHAGRDVVRHQGRNADAEIDVETVAQFLGGALGHLLAGPGHMRPPYQLSLTNYQ